MAKASQPTKAYSYIRFSTAEQAQGDSHRRQLEGAQDYARRHGLILDETLQCKDQGVSAFRGTNASDGALGEFLEAVRAGVVLKGSYLLVENLDRLSRQTARKALRTLEDIIDSGITVVTLMDGRKYTADSIDKDPTSLLIALLIMVRAHEESATKSRRAKAAFRAAVEKARQGVGRVSHKHPSWLRYDDATSTYVAIPEHVEVIRRIFKMFAAGTGKDSIAATLNEDRVPVFGKGKRWYGSFIYRLLKNPALLGELHPNEREHVDGRRQNVPLAPIPKYYPAVISKRDFERAAAISSAGNNPQRGRHSKNAVSNVWGGLSRCPICDETMTRTSKSSGSKPYLVCAKAKSGAGCKFVTTPYAQTEDALFSDGDWLVAHAPESGDKGRALQKELKELNVERDVAIEALENLTAVAERGGVSVLSITRRIEEIQAENDRLKDRAAQIEGELMGLGPTVIRHRLGELERALKEKPRNLTAVNSCLRALLEKAVIDYKSGQIELHWKHGGTTNLTYAWPKEE